MRKHSLLIKTVLAIVAIILLSIVVLRIVNKKATAPTKNSTDTPLKNPDYISLLLTEVVYQSEVETTDIQDDLFSWKVNKQINLNKVKGRSIETCTTGETPVPQKEEKISLLEQALKNQGFTTNKDNTQNETTGWEKSGVICSVAIPTIFNNNDIKDAICIKLICAELRELEKYEQILKLLENKYSKSNLTIFVEQEDSSHLRGTLNSGTNEGKLIFIAVKEREEWLLAYSGDGEIPCAKVEKYDFSKEMLPECLTH